MKLSDLKYISEATGPARFDTGAGKTTVPNPAHMSTVKYEGDPAGYNFGPQKKNYDAIKAALARQGKKLNYIGVAVSAAGPDTFVATAPNFIWVKYVAASPQGGQNDVYVNGVKMHTSSFVGADPATQDQWLGSDPAKLVLQTSGGDLISYAKKLKQMGIEGPAFNARMDAVKTQGLAKLLSRFAQAYELNKVTKDVNSLRKMKLGWPELEPHNINKLAKMGALKRLKSYLGSGDHWGFRNLISGYISVGVITTPDQVVASFFNKDKDGWLETLSTPKELTGGNIEEIIDIMELVGVEWPELNLKYLANLSKGEIFQQFRNKIISSDFYYNRGWNVLPNLAKLGLSKDEFAKSLEANKDHILATFAKNMGIPDREANWIHAALEIASVGIHWPEIAALFDEHKKEFMLLALKNIVKGDVRGMRVLKKLIEEYNLDWPEMENTQQLANDNKREIIISMLKTVKGGNLTDIENLRQTIKFLRDEGIDWPEFAAIEKSINSQELREESTLNRLTQLAGIGIKQ